MYPSSLCASSKLKFAAILAGGLAVQACDREVENASNNQAAEAGPPIVQAKPGDQVGNQLARRAAAGRSRRSPFGLGPLTIGPEVDAAEYPWQVGLRVTVGTSEWPCGGTLISPSFILTAAHCLDAASEGDYSIIRRVTPQMIEIFHGDSRYGMGTKIAADPSWQPQIHRLYKTDSTKPFAYDAGLIRLTRPFTGGRLAPVRSVRIGPQEAVVSGWGAFDTSNQLSTVLRAINVPVIDDVTCSNHLPSNKRDHITATSLCTESPKKDACGGDSGGPLVIGSRQEPQLVGIVSWGPSGYCAVPGPRNTLIGGYTRTSAIADWIRQQTGDPAALTTAPPGPLLTVTPAGEGTDR